MRRTFLGMISLRPILYMDRLGFSGFFLVQRHRYAGLASGLVISNLQNPDTHRNSEKMGLKVEGVILVSLIR